MISHVSSPAWNLVHSNISTHIHHTALYTFKQLNYQQWMSAVIKCRGKIKYLRVSILNQVCVMHLSWILAPGRGREEKGGGGEGRYFYPNNLNMTVLSPSNEQQQLYLYSTLNLYDTTNIYIAQKMKRVQAVHNNHWGLKR